MSVPKEVVEHEQAEQTGDNPAIPAAEHGNHDRSPAAHLNEQPVHDHTKPQGNLRQGSAPGARREPPMVVQRVGKQHR